MGLYRDLFPQNTAGKKALLVEETTEQSIGMAETRVYSRYATSGKEMQKIPFEVRSLAKKYCKEFSNLTPF